MKEQGDDSIEILFDGLETLKIFAKLIKKENILNVKFLDVCSINNTIKYTLKGSSNAMNLIGLIAF